MYENYNYGYDTAITAGASAFAGIMVVVWLISMAVSILCLVSMIKIFKKAGKPWWATLVPIYNIIVMTEIAGLSGLYVLLMFIPFANIYATIKVMLELAKKFGKDTGFAILLILLPYIGFPILAFSKCEYLGNSNSAPVAEPNTPPVGTPSPTEPTQDIIASPEMSASPINQSMNVETQAFTEAEQQGVQEVAIPAEPVVNQQTIDTSLQSVSNIDNEAPVEAMPISEPASLDQPINPASVDDTTNQDIAPQNPINQ